MGCKEFVTRIAFVFCGRYRYPVADGITADDGSACVYARSAHCSLQHLGVLDGVVEFRVGTCLGFPQFRNLIYCIREIHFFAAWQFVGDGFAQTV